MLEKRFDVVVKGEDHDELRGREGSKKFFARAGTCASAKPIAVRNSAAQSSENRSRFSSMRQPWEIACSNVEITLHNCRLRSGRSWWSRRVDEVDLAGERLGNWHASPTQPNHIQYREAFTEYVVRIESRRAL